MIGQELSYFVGIGMSEIVGFAGGSVPLDVVAAAAGDGGDVVVG